MCCYVSWFCRHCFAKLSPVCAVVGGVLGQEIIKVCSLKVKIHSFFKCIYYRAYSMVGIIIH